MGCVNTAKLLLPDMSIMELGWRWLKNCDAVRVTGQSHCQIYRQSKSTHRRAPCTVLVQLKLVSINLLFPIIWSCHHHLESLLRSETCRGEWKWAASACHIKAISIHQTRSQTAEAYKQKSWVKQTNIFLLFSLIVDDLSISNHFNI